MKSLLILLIMMNYYVSFWDALHMKTILKERPCKNCMTFTIFSIKKRLIMKFMEMVHSKMYIWVKRLKEKEEIKAKKLKDIINTRLEVLIYQETNKKTKSGRKKLMENILIWLIFLKQRDSNTKWFTWRS